MIRREDSAFYGNQLDPEKSLFWFGFNNKRGITLNLESPEGRQLFIKLVAGVDFLIESFTPGYLDALNIGYAELSKTNPRIVVASITPFGQSGPYSQFKASDIEIMALSGCMSLTGDPDRPPLRVTFPQSYGWTGSYAAMGALMRTITVNSPARASKSMCRRKPVCSGLFPMHTHFGISTGIWKNARARS